MTKPIRQQFADTMLEIGRQDEDLVVVVGDISHGILQTFAKARPDHYYNIGILEPTMMSMGAGLSAAGLIPVIHTIAPFIIERSYEQLKLDFCYHQLAGNIVTVGGAFDYSNLGCTHHCYSDFALAKTLPGSQICAPASAVEFDALFRQSYRNDHLTIFRLCGVDHGFGFAADDIVFGKANVIAPGNDVTLVATGTQLRTALRAREVLSGRGIGAEIVYVHTIRPLDIETIQASVGKTRTVVVIEEHLRAGGLGDDVLRACYQVPGLRHASVAIEDRFITGYGSYDALCEEAGLTVDAVVAAAIGSGHG